MNAIGLKYVGNREEGIMVMLFRSYKTVKIHKRHPYRFTNKDRSDAEACNYYKKLSNLGLALVYQESDLSVEFDSKHEVRTEPLAAEVDVQIDPLQVAQTPEDQMSVDLAGSAESPESDEIIGSTVTPSESNDLAIDKSTIKLMSPAELSEYMEMNFSKDQLKTLISDLGLDISAGRKGVPNLISEIMSTADTDVLTDYLCR